VTLVGKLNLNYKDFHLGVAGERKGADVSKLYAQFVVADKDKLYWARTDVKDETVGVGCSIDQENRSHSHEIVYDRKKDAKGFKDFPVEIRNGSEYKLSDATSVGFSSKLGEHLSFEVETSHKVDKNWTVSVIQNYDHSRKGSKLPLYDFSVHFEYKLWAQSTYLNFRVDDIL